MSSFAVKAETHARQDGVTGASAIRATGAAGRLKVRLADGSESDCQAGIVLAREAHESTIFRDIPFFEAKARAIFEKAVATPDRFGQIYAVPDGDLAVADRSDGA